MKKYLSALLLVLVLLVVLVGCNDASVYNKELVVNGDFEQTGETLDGWQSKKVLSNSNDGVLTIKNHRETKEDYGKTYLTIDNDSKSGNYSYVYQEIAVEKKGIYKVNALIRNNALSKGRNDRYTGANISILEGETILAKSNRVGDWTEYTAYIKPKNTDKITVALCLGAKDSFAVGTACFDNVSVVKVKEAPAGAEVIEIVKQSEKVYPLSSVEGIVFIVVLSVISAGLIVGAYFLYRKLFADSTKQPLFKNTIITTSVLVGLGLLLRFILAGTLFARGNAVYLTNMAKDMADMGLANIYDSGQYNQFAPLAMFQMWLAGVIVKDWASYGATSVMIRLFAILADGVVIAVLYLFGRKFVNEKQAVLMSCLYAILPISFVLSAGYDVVVPVLSMLLLLLFVAIINKNYIGMFILSFIAVLWSPIAIAILPFVVLYEIMVLVNEKDKKLTIKFSIGWVVSFILFILASMPVCWNTFKTGHIFNIFSRYITMMFKSQVSLSNAFNLYGLFGLNGKGINTAAFWLNIVFAIILMVYTLSLYFKNKNRAELMLLGSFFLIAISVFSLNMNETAMAIGLVLLLAYIMVSNENRLFWIFGSFAVLSFVNLSCVMNMSGALGELMKLTYFAKGSVLYGFGNVLSSIAVIYFGWVVYDITCNSKRKQIYPLKVKETETI